MPPFDASLWQPGADVLLAWAMRQFYLFLLVLVRTSGLMIVGPLFGQSIVPGNVRALLVVVVALLVTPALVGQSRVGFRRMDADQDGRLVREEVPPHLQDQFDDMLDAAGKGPEASLRPHEFRLQPELPSTILDFAATAVGEIALGFALGLGVLILLSGLQLAGQLIDQQTGFALAEIVNPGFDTEGSLTSQFYYLLGVTVFLVLSPVNGHLMMVSTLVETFQTLPVGTAFLGATSIQYLGSLVHESMLLAFQVAAPLLAVTSLVALTMGFLGPTVPQINVLVVGFPVRVLITLMMLALALHGGVRVVVDQIPVVIGRLADLLAFPT